MTVAPLPAGPRGLDTELALRLPSDVAFVEEAVDLVARHLETRFADQRAIRFNVRVALSEALANAILYGNRSDPAKHVDVRARFGPQEIEIEVEDQGPGFDPAALDDPTTPERLEGSDGRGIYLIRRLVDDVHFAGRGNVVCMTLRRPLSGLDAVLDALRRLAGARVEAWRVEEGRALALGAASGAWAPPLDGAVAGICESPAGPAWLEPVPGFAAHWLQLGPDRDDALTRPARARAAAFVLGEVLRGELEAAQVATELATRYEEIDLLYTISDILGHTVRLNEAAQTIAREVADVVGARRASILVFDESANALRLVAGRGLETYDIAPIHVDDPRSISARVFREREMLAFDRASPGTHPGFGPGRGYKGKSFIALPIVYAPPGGEPRVVGVFNLTDRIGDDVFTAGHKKLLTAIANQVGAAIENARLVEGERHRVRIDTELMLARDLQSALMQPQAARAGDADVGARTHSAETVGGDFYKFMRRTGAVGVLVGDVSSHGLSAAMLMAHVIAAAGIVAQETREPRRALGRLLEVVGGELARAEMHVAVFYAILDRRRGILSFANAGHPQAFLLRADGEAERLGATAPPLGLGNARGLKGRKLAWDNQGDLLVLFSDGFPDATNAQGERYGESRLLELIRHHRSENAAAIVDHAFRDLEAFAGTRPDDDRTLVIVRG